MSTGRGVISFSNGNELVLHIQSENNFTFVHMLEK